MLARACLAAALATAVAGCGAAHHRAPAKRAAARPVPCTQRLPLGTLLDGARGGGSAPRPLILALHGARQGGYGMQHYTGLSEDARDFLVAYPTTPHRTGFWQVGDVGRLLALVDAIDRCTPVSTVTAIGFSNGGLMANALACHAADRVRAIVLVASGYEGLGPCRPSRPVSVLAIHGTSDPVVGYGGLKAFVGTWARRDGCSPRPTAHREPEFVTHFRWHGCRGGSRVEHLRISGDEHGWPSLEDANGPMLRFLRAVV